MTQLDRRIEKLEADTYTDTDKVTLLFVSWMKSADEPAQRLTTRWKHEQFDQEPGESEETFKSRVRGAVARNRPAGNNVAVVFLHAVDILC